ncbi:MAG: hypothetical protein J6M60_01540 [Clostridia bacterium]|nr:hypothetical protein [Clostridia bacterium]
MKIKQAFVTRENPAEIFSIIEDVLSTRPNTQVFVDDKIYEELSRNGSDYNVYSHNYMKRVHYQHDNDNFGGEEWLALSEGCYFDKVIARGSFISNCNEYMQLVEFHSSKIKEYIHYCSGFKQLLLIRFKPKS